MFMFSANADAVLVLVLGREDYDDDNEDENKDMLLLGWLCMQFMRCEKLLRKSNALSMIVTYATGVRRVRSVLSFPIPGNGP